MDINKHIQFYEDELIAQNEEFLKKCNSKAVSLLEDKGEMFVALFQKFSDSGEMIMKFPNKRSLPRKNEYLYCMYLPGDLSKFRTWGDSTYGDLIKQKDDATTCVCIWTSKCDDDDYSLVGFRGIDLGFKNYIQQSNAKPILVFGPNRPPFEYLCNLQNVVKKFADINETSYSLCKVSSDNGFMKLTRELNIPAYLLNRMETHDSIILQGPPGTGKTFIISQICKILCDNKKSVLVTSLTNRALMELALKPALSSLLAQKRVFKSHLTADEEAELPSLSSIDDVTPIQGSLVLSTFYVSSAYWLNNVSRFDYVIVDEASQAYLAMLFSAQLSADKTIYVGDISQMPPITMINSDKIVNRGYYDFVNGLEHLVKTKAFPLCQLVETFRLNSKSAEYTSLFYREPLLAVNVSDCITVDGIDDVFQISGGPVMLKMDLPVGDSAPECLINLVCGIVSQMLNQHPKLKIAILSHLIKTTKQLQKGVVNSVGSKYDVIVETVARVQGLTTDVTFFVIPNNNYVFSLEERLFNVATSRAKQHTIIVCDKDILSCTYMPLSVRKYLSKLEMERSFYMSGNRLALKR